MMTTRKTSTRITKANAPVYQLRIELVDVHPEVWRTVRIPGSATLTKVHGTILRGMGWAGGHLHEFTIGDETYGMPDPEFDDGREIKPEGRHTLAGTVGEQMIMTTVQCATRAPWNKGKLVGQKAPLRVRDVWPSVRVCSFKNERETLHCSTLVSTASCAALTSLVFEFVTSGMGRRCIPYAGHTKEDRSTRPVRAHRANW